MSSTEYADVFNVTDIVGNVTDGDVTSSNENSGSTCDINLLRLICEVYISIPICVFGVVGNILEIIVLTVDKKEKSTVVYLQALAVLDSLLLTFAFLLQSLNTVANEYDVMPRYEEAYHYVFLACYPCTYVVRTAGIWTTVSLTFDRYIAVSRPFSSLRMCTKSRACKQVSSFGCFCSLFIFSSPFLLSLFVICAYHVKAGINKRVNL